MLNRERNHIVAEVFLAVEENNNSKDSGKKTMKKKWQDKKPLLAGYSGFCALLLATQTRHSKDYRTHKFEKFESKVYN